MTRFEPSQVSVDPEQLPPRCPECDEIVKGDTVHFGEPIPPDVLRRCYEEVKRCDCMLVPAEVARRGGAVIEVNPDPTELTPLATRELRGPGGAVLERLLHHALLAGEGARA